jgi:hypothetical protein
MVKRLLVVAALLAISAGCLEDEAKKALAQTQAKQKGAEAQAKVNADAVATANAEIKKANEIIKQLRKENSELKAAMAKANESVSAKEEAKEVARMEAAAMRAGFEKITTGADIDTVERILGKGKQVSQANGRTTMRWRSADKSVTIEVVFNPFSGNVPLVVAKSIID